MTRRCVFCYDIAHPKRLYRVARLLESVGERVQDSVFECWLDHRQYAVVRNKLTRLLHHDEDKILVYQLTLAEGCDIYLFGKAFKTDDLQFVID